ncbi:GTP-binding protein RHO1-like [Actinia tenebrosa]|uniref:GTP-binding protein RHO1-like n=1 Tax=Actinia tenebrosa TaxID=6105 RepID=A0A6P8HUF8_ACTTE|nr:GTP-binding protein RHO1-like [Actinia tenebrosa]XP_031558883.1 GTP-binding protein RHO1-like [Actinia tenebrosa]
MVVLTVMMARRRRGALPVITEPGFVDLTSTDRESCSNTCNNNDEQSISKVLLKPPSVADEASCACSVERYKLTVVGDSECGKTSLLNALVKSDFDFEVEESAIFDECVTDIKSGDSSLEFMLCDCSGLENYESIRRYMYAETDVFLLCFDIGNPSSLDNIVSKWVKEIKEECPGVPYLLVGCKNDLRTDSALQFYLTVPGDSSSEPDSISRIKAISTAQSIGAKDYVECCAKTRWNIKEVFKGAADAILCKEENTEVVKPQSMLRRFSRFARRSSAADATANDCNSVALSFASGPRRLSLFSTG